MNTQTRRSDDDALLADLFDGQEAYDLGKWAYKARSFNNPYRRFVEEGNYWAWELGYQTERQNALRH